MTIPPCSPAGAPFWDELAPTMPDDPIVLTRLSARLAAAADAAGLLDVAYRTLDSPVGELLLAATPAGLVRIAFVDIDHDAILRDLAARVSPRLLHAPALLDGAARALAEYFSGRRREFALPLDLRLARGFRREVLGALPMIPYGETASYGELAARLDHPRASRAVGTACAMNPLPLVIPCHRVVRADGTTGDYVGGPAAKRYLLRLEAGRARG